MDRWLYMEKYGRAPCRPLSCRSHQVWTVAHVTRKLFRRDSVVPCSVRAFFVAVVFAWAPVAEA